MGSRIRFMKCGKCVMCMFLDFFVLINMKFVSFVVCWMVLFKFWLLGLLLKRIGIFVVFGKCFCYLISG